MERSAIRETDDNDDKRPFRDLDDFRATMARRLGERDGAWRTCGDRRCARARRCRDERAPCQAGDVRDEFTEEQEALAMIELRAALQARLRDHGN